MEKIKQLSSKDQEKQRKAAREIWKTIITTLRDTKPPLKNTITTQARKLAKAIKQRKPYQPHTIRH